MFCLQKSNQGCTRNHSVLLIKSVPLKYSKVHYRGSATHIKGYCTSEAPQATGQKVTLTAYEFTVCIPKVMWHPLQTDLKRAQNTDHCV